MSAPGAARPNPQDPATREGGRFVFRARVFYPDDLRRAHTRIAHEIVERNHGADRRRPRRPLHPGGGDRPAARRGHRRRSRASTCRSASLDVAFYRDDIGLRPVQPLGPTEVPVDVGGRTVRPGRRRAVHRPHRPRRARRAHRARPTRARCSSRCSSTGATASCRSGPTSSARTCPPSAAEDVRVRLAEVDGGDDGVELWGAGRAPSRRGGHLMRDLLSIDDLDALRPRASSLDLGESFLEVTQPRHPEGARAARQDGGVAVLRGLDPHPAVVRDRGEAPLGRHDDLLGQRLVGRRRARACATRCRPSRRWASTRSSCATSRRGRPAPGRDRGSTPAVVNAGDGRHEHPTQALLDAFTLRRHRGTVARRLPGRDRRRHRATPGWRAATRRRSPRSAPTSPWSARRR